MKQVILYFVIIFLTLTLYPDYTVKKIDFLKKYNLNVNAAGPLIIKTDTNRSITYLANTNTSSVTLLKGKENKIINIPIKKRIPQYLKDSAMVINKKNGFLYLIGDKSLNIIFLNSKKSLSIDTKYQYEMLSVNSKTGDAYLTGIESKYIGFYNYKKKTFKIIPWLSSSSRKVNLNQTPPPSLRKVFVDPVLKKIFALDGAKSEFYTFNLYGKLLNKRKIICKGGDRWHFAGLDKNKHFLYLVLESKKREVTEALKIDLKKNRDISITLPKKREGVGISFNPIREEIYIPYDNHSLTHIVSFKDKNFYDVFLPTFGNDASVVNMEKELLYIASWAKGDILIIDLKKRKMIKRIKDMGIIPHMFSLSLDSKRNKLYIPIGATAVNGSFGSSITELDLVTYNKKKIYTGWAPIAITTKKKNKNVYVFNSEDQYAEVQPDGKIHFKKLPVSFINNAITGKNGEIYVSYGPHQSYWPTVYIWGAKNGIITINNDNSELYDRRIPRMAQGMVLDRSGCMFLLQNNWGKEKQFLTVLKNNIIDFEASNRLVLNDDVIRETTQRILKYDPDMNWLYVVRTGEKDDMPGILQVIDLRTNKILKKFTTGLTPIDLIFDDNYIYVSNFDSDTITMIDKFSFKKKEIATFSSPTILEFHNKEIYLISHLKNKITRLSSMTKTIDIPFPGKPSMLKKCNNGLIITSHTENTLNIILYKPETGKFNLLHSESYPFMDTTVSTNNTAFYVRGQFADGIFSTNKIIEDDQGIVWISDYLSGKLFILKKL